jgi:hypothetical protein
MKIEKSKLEEPHKQLDVDVVIPRYKFGAYPRDNTVTEYHWFIIDIHTDNVVENLKDMELYEVRNRCREWNDNYVL